MKCWSDIVKEVYLKIKYNNIYFIKYNNIKGKFCNFVFYFHKKNILISEKNNNLYINCL